MAASLTNEPTLNLDGLCTLLKIAEFKVGDVITADVARCFSLGFGLAPKFINSVVGRVVNKDVRKATAMSHDLINYTL